ncbi:MAG: HAD-IA family hydrolase, partial [Ornithinimicrobium sp.]
PGAARALHAVAARGAVVTSATHALGMARLQAAQLPIPEVVVSADDVRHGKPDPEPYLLAASRLNVAPRQCLVVEDAPSGIASARAAGCAVLAVVTTTAEADLPADLVVPDLSSVQFELAAGGLRVHMSGSDQEMSGRD